MVPVLTQNTSHVAIGLGRLILQFREKPRLAVLLTAILTEVQAVENALWQVLTQRLTNGNPVGAQLDVLGRIVGQPREGLSDAAYLPLINARIRANKSDSTVNTLITILQLIVGKTTPILVREYAKAIELELDGLVTVNAFQIWREFLDVAKEAGTSIRFIFSNAPATNTLKMTTAYPGSSFTTVLTQRVDTAFAAPAGGLLAGAFA